MRQQRQKSKTVKKLINGHTVIKIGRSRWQVKIDGQIISGTLSYCVSAAFQAEKGHSTEESI